jgi:serine/threonine-protein kinase
MSEAVGRLSAALSDRCVIERELGAGGMATVYLAHDVRRDRKVALKVLRPELSAILGAERFRRGQGHGRPPAPARQNGQPGGSGAR